MELLFVYGTLRQGFENPVSEAIKPLLRFLSKASVKGRLYEINGYPGFIEDEKGYPVKGDLYELIDETSALRILDEYEECSDSYPVPHEYVRKMLEITLPDETSVFAWVYVYNFRIEGKKEIISGDFR
jgi:gamma-glutamylcyclotransferase (GGCT)/AIG2-like uncharacterized protein YtfP